MFYICHSGCCTWDPPTVLRRACLTGGFKLGVSVDFLCFLSICARPVMNGQDFEYKALTITKIPVRVISFIYITKKEISGCQ